MTHIEQTIAEFEHRPAVFGIAEQSKRMSMLNHFCAINKFEGITPSETDERLFQLLITGKISKQEYLDICLNDARGSEQ